MPSGLRLRSCALTHRHHSGVATATERELFDFVTDPTIGAHNIDACLDRLIAAADERAANGGGCVGERRKCPPSLTPHAAPQGHRGGGGGAARVPEQLHSAAPRRGDAL